MGPAVSPHMGLGRRKAMQKGGHTNGCPPWLKNVSPHASPHNTFKKFHRAGQLRLIGMALGNSANQLEGAKGIESITAVLTENISSLKVHCFRNSLCIAFFFAP